MLSSFSKLAALSLTLSLFGAGCVAEVRARPAYAGYSDYDSYPHTVYHGRTVYYFDDGWHYRSGRSWVYVDEAPDLGPAPTLPVEQANSAVAQVVRREGRHPGRLARPRDP